jgi:hypothetical protein
LLLLAVSALAENAKNSYLPGIDFSQYKTYSWANTQPHPNPDVDAEIKRVLDSQLAAKHLTKAADHPDLIVDYRVALSSEEKWPAFRYNEIEPGGDKPVIVHTGTLALNLRDPKRNQIVWWGHVESAVEPNSKKKSQILERAAKALLRQYPPSH